MKKSVKAVNHVVDQNYERMEKMGFDTYEDTDYMVFTNEKTNICMGRGEQFILLKKEIRN